MDASKLVDDALAKVSDLGTVGAMKWLAAAIAPPVAAGSVDIATLDAALDGWVPPSGVLYRKIVAWGAQQREAGRREMFAEVEEENAILAAKVEKAEARVKELGADRQSLQAEGKHPAPCARHCEANAFQIEVRRLQAETAHKQAIIDRLMLEYCPDEMTAEQVKEWGEHQVRADPEQMQWQPNKDQRLAGVSNERLHKGYDALRGKDPSINFDFDVDGKTLTLTRQEIDTELEARGDAPIPF